MKEYLEKLKSVCFPMYRTLKNNEEHKQKITLYDPDFEER